MYASETSIPESAESVEILLNAGRAAEALDIAKWILTENGGRNEPLMTGDELLVFGAAFALSDEATHAWVYRGLWSPAAIASHPGLDAGNYCVRLLWLVELLVKSGKAGEAFRALNLELAVVRKTLPVELEELLQRLERIEGCADYVTEARAATPEERRIKPRL